MSLREQVNIPGDRSSLRDTHTIEDAFMGARRDSRDDAVAFMAHHSLHFLRKFPLLHQELARIDLEVLLYGNFRALKEFLLDIVQLVIHVLDFGSAVHD